MGRPTKYTEDLPEKLLAFFDVELDTIREKEVAGKDGMFKVQEVVPNRLPTVEGFCKKLKISKSTFHEWVQKYPDFSNALGKAKAMQMNHLMQHTLEGTYNANFAKFLAINISEYREKIETTVEQTNININVDKDDVEL